MNSLDIELEKILNEYSHEVKDVLESCVDEVAKDTVDELKKTSPKKTGKYSKSWKKKEEPTLTSKNVIIYNTKGQLTHLLEFGHGLHQGGRTRAFPHIKPAEENAKSNFERRLREKLGK